MAVIASVSKFGGFPATLCIIALMLCYVIFGGVWGAGLVEVGVLISAFLIPIIGIAGILVGMYMKLNDPTLSPAKALPTFIMLHVPALLAGAIMATLLVAVVGTGAGLALGMSSMICNDIYKVYFNKNASDQTTLNASRIIIVGILLGASLFTLGNMGSLILGWSFNSIDVGRVFCKRHYISKILKCDLLS